MSGGLDSATALYLARKQGYRCLCLVFDYGQRHRKETRAARKIAARAGCPCQVLKIKMPWDGSALLDKKIAVPAHRLKGQKGRSAIPSTYVPGRNIIFLSFALSFAEAAGAKAVFIGAHAHDYSGYPDCRPEFYRAFKGVVSVGTRAGIEKKEIKIIAPLLYKNKAEIIRLACRLGVPLELTWSCYRGGKVPCLTCDSCHYRRKGFRQAGLKDPLLN